MDEIPFDILMSIIILLKPSDVMRLSLTNKRLSTTLDSSETWSMLLKNRFSIKDNDPKREYHRLDQESVKQSSTTMDITWGHEAQYWRRESGIASLLIVFWLLCIARFKFVFNGTYTPVLKIKVSRTFLRVPDVEIIVEVSDTVIQSHKMSDFDIPTDEWVELLLPSIKVERMEQVIIQIKHLDSRIIKQGLDIEYFALRDNEILERELTSINEPDNNDNNTGLIKSLTNKMMQTLGF